MKVSELNKATELFLLENGDADVVLLNEHLVFDEGFNSKLYEHPTDIRKVSDWPLPGISLMFPNEGAEMSSFFVVMYGDTPY